MRGVLRLILQPSIWVCLAIISAPISGMIPMPYEIESEREELKQEVVRLYASSPGHTVFGEYVGGHWCPPCMDSASPSLTNLKSSNPDDFTYVSFFESSSSGWPNDSPVNRMDHIMTSSTGYPTFSFADSQSGNCYKVGASGTNFYDTDFSNGGCMSSQSNDFELSLSMILNTTTEDVSITLDAIYTGPDSSVEAHVYGAVTEKIGADSYDNGVKPGHNWRGWLLNSTNSGFVKLTLLKNTWTSHTWETPLSQVRSSSGNSQWENFWPVFALMDGDHSTYNDFLVAIDPDMGPMVDVGISDFTVQNRNQMAGFVPGDMLDLTLEVSNNGVEGYSDGGNMGIYMISGSDEVYIGGKPIGSLGIDQSTILEIEYDTSDIDSVVSGVSTFRAKLSDLGGDRNSSNDIQDRMAPHDLPPTPSQPAATGSTTFERGDKVTFELSAMPNDLVDDVSSMSPSMQYSFAGQSLWEDSWVSEPELVGSGANQIYAQTIQSPPNAQTGHYDTRVRWQDAAGQNSQWLVSSNAFELKNALPKVLTAQDSGFAGIPAVKVETIEKVSVVGLVRDAETPLSMLTIDSEDSDFVAWDPDELEISVRFSSIDNDPSGNPIPQGIFVKISDGEDENSGMILFNVIENGAPRWSPVPTQPVFEGGSTSMSMTPFLTDSDDDGNVIPTSELTLSIVSNDNEDLIHATVNGHALSVSTLNDDSHGVARVIIEADDGAKTSQTTVVFYVINVNDPPVIEVESLQGMNLKSGDKMSLNISDLISDVDDPDDEVWVEVNTAIPGAARFNHLTGELAMHWEEPGSHTVSLTLIDSHGDWSESHFAVTVLDSKPITWKTDFQAGDLEVTIDDLHIGGEPIVEIQNIGPLVLSNIKIRWSICNGIVGICHSAGAVDGLGPFPATPSDGGGMSVGDYLTLSVKAVDNEGWDRETRDILEILLPTTSEIPDLPMDSEEEVAQDQQSNQQDTGFSALEIIAGILILIIFLGGGALAGLYFSGYFANRNSHLSQAPQNTQNLNPNPNDKGEQVVDFENRAPEHPPLPEGGLPEGWTMEQWKYYGNQWLERNK